MENNKKVINGVLKTCTIVSGVSGKGTNYKVLKVELVNGYVEDIFLTNSLSQIVDIIIKEKKL